MKNTLNLDKINNTGIKLSQTSEEQRNRFLYHLANILLSQQAKIIKANQADIQEAKIKNLSLSFIDRLTLNKKEIEKIILRLQELERLKSGLGEIIKERKRDNLKFKKVRVPLGVIMVIYEARPEVTIDVASLCIKSGNAAILKGGSEALKSNQVLFNCILSALKKAKLPKETINFIATSNRKLINNLLTKNDFIDLVIARGGYRLVKTVLAKSRIPVLAHAAGGARIYIDKTADLSIIEKIIINAKTNKPAACNSLDTLVIHKDIAKKIISKIINRLRSYNVEIVGDSFCRNFIKIDKAKDKDWDKEFLGLKLAIKVVKDIYEAIEFINRHSKKHSEGIIASNEKTIDCFIQSIDAAAIFINCSTRLHDGYVFGLGSEMGIATGKLHARGPVGLSELTTYKWIVEGNGHIRK